MQLDNEKPSLYSDSREELLWDLSSRVGSKQGSQSNVHLSIWVLCLCSLETGRAVERINMGPGAQIPPAVISGFNLQVFLLFLTLMRTILQMTERAAKASCPSTSYTIPHTLLPILVIYSEENLKGPIVICLIYLLTATNNLFPTNP